jgi:hypothetical protein
VTVGRDICVAVTTITTGVGVLKIGVAVGLGRTAATSLAVGPFAPPTSLFKM